MVVLLIHGGAGTINAERKVIANNAILRIINEVYPKLEQGATALETVQYAVELLENDEAFNAGYGSVLTENGTIEMDALLMDGKTLAIGGVIGVSKIKNPIALSRLVMDSDRHVLFFGEGAEDFAVNHGMKLINPKDLITQRSLDRLKAWKEKQSEEIDKEKKYGTVGAVALDRDGNLAAATSTGGIVGKMVGRVGDTPLVGAGTYADELLACSATGIGENIIKGMLSFRIKTYMETGLNIQEATKKALEYTLNRVGPAGIIALDKDGNWIADKTTEDLAFGIRNENMVKSFMDLQ